VVLYSHEEMKHTVGNMHEKTEVTNERRIIFHGEMDQVGDNIHEETQDVSQTE
jgi:hypothetical protein